MNLHSRIFFLGYLANLVSANADIECRTIISCTTTSTTTTTTITTSTSTTTTIPPPDTITTTSTSTITTIPPPDTITTTSTSITTTIPPPDTITTTKKPPATITTTVTTTPESCQTSSQATPTPVCTDIVENWKPIRLDWTENYKKPGQPEPKQIETDYNFPTIFQLTDDMIKLEQYDVSIDGDHVGKTSNVLEGKRKDSCKAAEECIKKGFSHGKFEIPAGTHSIGISWKMAEQEDISDWTFGSGQYRFLRVKPCPH
ncbi:hypothetical protein EYZ11_012728 [Aspergillus tanneri]|uniref:Uncharacterized protein n=1 Tax=Aspergillus tanneri TaxID=1220188 RepID=A0A4S3J1M1_9EURO|nr:hypothetical protein EYZ11_012728 [Aspergillus tanneri]